jgi:hypothetical protein
VDERGQADSRITARRFRRLLWKICLGVWARQALQTAHAGVRQSREQFIALQHHDLEYNFRLSEHGRRRFFENGR